MKGLSQGQTEEGDRAGVERSRPRLRRALLRLPCAPAELKSSPTFISSNYRSFFYLQLSYVFVSRLLCALKELKSAQIFNNID